MKIKAENYPVILIAAFFIGMIIAMALGFRPDYGSHRDRPGEADRMVILQVPEFSQGYEPWQ
jgi:hypothetical protein